MAKRLFLDYRKKLKAEEKDCQKDKKREIG